MVQIAIKRVYDLPAEDDGYRVLVDRVWPRGMAKDAAALDRWAKDLAPSDQLRKWFGHDPKRWQEFRDRYLDELKGGHSKLLQLLEECRGRPLTLLYSARDRERNQAVVLREAMMMLAEPRGADRDLRDGIA